MTEKTTIGSNLAIGISPITGQAYIGKLNKKGTERISKEPIPEKMLEGFVLGYLEAELEKMGGAFNRPFAAHGKRKTIYVSIKDEVETA